MLDEPNGIYHVIVLAPLQYLVMKAAARVEESLQDELARL